ncbi:MAG: hypothetical protein ABIH63_01040, partial [archaeon]
MKKWWYFLPILIGVFFVLGCTEKPILSDIQVAACNSAHDNNNCDKLGDLGLVTKSDCCSALSKCCTNLLTGNVVSSISSSLSDVQVVACESAASVDSCDKLVNLGIVTEDECCSELGLCCTWVPVEEFKEVLIQAIKDYFSDTSVLTVDELKDLIVVYFSTSGDYVDLSGVGQYSGENLLDIYEKAKAASPGLSIKLWVEGNPSSVPYNSEFNVMWSAPGAVSCAGYGHHVPAVGGGLWTESPNLSAEGSKRLYARHANYGYITPLELGLSCFDGKSNNAFNKEIFVNVD